MFKTTVGRVYRVRAPTGDELDIPLDSDGFLDAPELVKPTETIMPGEFVDAAGAARLRVLLMLGEPGLGKSTALRSIVDVLEGCGAEVHWFDGADLDERTFDEEEGSPLLAPAAEPDMAQSPVAVVLDGLDESPILRRLPRQISTGGGGSVFDRC